MSILINREMPKNCLECPCYNDELDICNITSQPTTIEDWHKLKADCPLIEVPKHGRLIDADALKNDIKAEADFLDANCGEDEHSFKVGSLSAYGRAIGCVRDAPTIIEAEGEE